MWTKIRYHNIALRLYGNFYVNDRIYLSICLSLSMPFTFIKAVMAMFGEEKRVEKEV